MASANGREGWKLVCMPGEAMKKRLEMAAEAEAKAKGCPSSSITYQMFVPMLLTEALDARGVPRVDEER